MYILLSKLTGTLNPVALRFHVHLQGSNMFQHTFINIYLRRPVTGIHARSVICLALQDVFSIVFWKMFQYICVRPQVVKHVCCSGNANMIRAFDHGRKSSKMCLPLIVAWLLLLHPSNSQEKSKKHTMAQVTL